MRHHHFIACQQVYIAADGGKSAPLHLKGLSETRWNCRAESLNRLAKPQVYRSVIDTIEHVADTTSDGTVRGVASGLRTSLMHYNFIAQLFTMQPVGLHGAKRSPEAKRPPLSKYSCMHLMRLKLFYDRCNSSEAP